MERVDQWEVGVTERRDDSPGWYEAMLKGDHPPDFGSVLVPRKEQARDLTWPAVLMVAMFCATVIALALIIVH